MKNQIPEIKNPLVHAGTNRFERLSKEMQFSYVQIEERHEADFLDYAAKLASQFQFYDLHNNAIGNWQSFFNDSVPSNRPHKALFIAFLRLLEALNEHANGLSKRHLDFYYKDVLHFVEQEAQPTHVHVFFSCAKALEEKLLEKGTGLLAGETEEGNKIVFELVDELIVNQAKLVRVLSVYRHDDIYGNRIYASDYTKQLNQPGASFPLFGEEQLVTKKQSNGDFKVVFSENPTMEMPEIGFALSSAHLYLEEGHREITLKLSTRYSTGINILSNQLTVLGTGKEGWIQVTIKNTVVAGSMIEFTLELANTAPALVNYESNIHGGQYQAKHPVIKFILQQTENYAYAAWKNIGVDDAELKVKVTGHRSLIVQNEESVLDASKPFRPFGARPSVGDHFYIGHSHIFNHKLVAAHLKIKWKDVQYEKFDKHYLNYSEPALGNSRFTVDTEILREKEWIGTNEQYLFNLQNAKNKSEIELNLTQADRSPVTAKPVAWNYQIDRGFVRLTLTGPETEGFQAFGHLTYPKEVVWANQNNKPLLNAPYTPIIEELVLDYETQNIKLSQQFDQDRFYHVSAYGQTELNFKDTSKTYALLPQYDYEGAVYLGVERVNVPQSITCWFEFLEGTANADKSQLVSNVQWSYLCGDEWKLIDKLRISKDTTRNLLNTGIIRFDLPADVDYNHQTMPSNLVWIKAEIPENSAGIDQVQGIFLQAAEAIAKVQPNDNYYAKTVAPHTIGKIVDGGQGIAETQQPFASFNGKEKETESLFYTRVTERLRHKDRGIMIWDYERLTLEAFPQLYKVKCLNHTNYQTEMVAGNVMIAVIPNLRNKGVQHPFQPRLGMHKRMEIHDFLKKRISPFINLKVENPIYEPVKLVFNVGFHEGKDEGFYGKKLHDDLQRFLSPWAFETAWHENSDLVFGGELHKSTVLKFIEDLPYVDFVNNFNFYHIYQNPEVTEDFHKGVIYDNTNYYSVAEPDGSCEVIRMKFQPEDLNLPTALLTIKVRFLNGLTGQGSLEEKFRKQLYSVLKSNADKGKIITKNLVKILIKNMYYVDKLVALSFYNTLPNGFVMEDTDVAIAKTSRSIIVTSEQHQIGVYRSGDYNCEGSTVIGIGYMIVEADFIVR